MRFQALCQPSPSLGVLIPYCHTCTPQFPIWPITDPFTDAGQGIAWRPRFSVNWRDSRVRVGVQDCQEVSPQEGGSCRAAVTLKQPAYPAAAANNSN